MKTDQDEDNPFSRSEDIEETLSEDIIILASDKQELAYSQLSFRSIYYI
jgi:hypothetical protein